jgi:hypothetical protein
MLANELDSTETLLPFEYYYLNYCPPKDLEPKHENLGSMILGETTQTTPYEVKKYPSLGALIYNSHQHTYKFINRYLRKTNNVVYLDYYGHQPALHKTLH